MWGIISAGRHASIKVLLPSRGQLSHLCICTWIMLSFFVWYQVYHATSLAIQQDSNIFTKVLCGIGNMLPWVRESFIYYLCQCQMNDLVCFGLCLVNSMVDCALTAQRCVLRWLPSRLLCRHHNTYSMTLGIYYLILEAYGVSSMQLVDVTYCSIGFDSR